MTDQELEDFVAAQLAALDTTPGQRYWRESAMGTPETKGSRAAAIATDDGYSRFDMRMPVGEARVIKRLAADRGIGMRTWVRMALATCVVGCEGVDPDEIPWMARYGPLRPPQ